MSSWEEPPSEFSTAPSSWRQNKREETVHTFRPIMDQRGDSYPAVDAARAPSSIPMNAFCGNPHQFSLYPYNGPTYDQYFNNTAAPYPPALPYTGYIPCDWNPEVSSVVESYSTIAQNQDHRLNSSLTHDHMDHTSTAWYTYTPVLPFAGHASLYDWNPEVSYNVESYPRLFQDLAANQQGFMSSRPAIHPSFDAAKIAAAWEARKSSKSQKQDRASSRRRQPLTAYNIFFSEQRDLILKELDAQEKGLPAPPPPNGPPAILSMVHRPIKRSHRKVHGKISLQALTRQIGQRWKALGARDKQRYMDWADQDKMRLSKEQEHATEGQDEKCWAPQGEKQELDNRH